MAIDLLEGFKGSRPLHFDLESLVWCTAWIVVCFSGGEDASQDPHPLAGWFTGHMATIGELKFTYFTKPRPPTDYYRETFQGLLDLLRAFEDGYAAQRRENSMPVFIGMKMFHPTFRTTDYGKLRTILIDA
jgi:hypothetical protein